METRRVDANPEKRFFIEMLIKDIELIPAIVDLVDNSVDAARSLRGKGSFDGLRVVLEAAPEAFRIEDNCGGIDAEVARRYAFRFGRPKDFRAIKNSVGQFGIGMKRALFKLGDVFVVESVAKDSLFRLRVDVEEWERDANPNWSFQFEDIETRRSRPEQRGTRIEVSSLHPPVADDFARDEIVKAIRREITMKHQAALGRGLLIEVNGRALAPYTPRLLASAKIKPVNEKFELAVDGAGTVDVQIVAGIARARERDELKDVDEPTQFGEAGDAGWYIYCNDRLVVAAEKTPLTGWGPPGAAYHPQYRRFRGYVFLNADDASLLPWNTTKTGLDQDSSVFRRVQQEMFRVLQVVQGVINRAKTERQIHSEDDQHINAAVASAKERDVSQLTLSRTFVAPSLAARRPVPSHLVSVQYRARRDLMEEVMDVLEVDSATKAGLLTFEYFVDAELDQGS